MTAPPSTPTARELARACVRVASLGKTLAVVYYRPPGDESGAQLEFGVCQSDAIPRMVGTLVDLLAPLVDLGLRHREAMQATPATRDPRPVQRIISTPRGHDANDGDPDD